MLPYLLGYDPFRVSPQFEGLTQKVHFYKKAVL